MLRDDDAFPMPSRIDNFVNGELEGEHAPSPLHEQNYTNDAFDDVFGSAPPSPTLDGETPTDGIWHGTAGNLEPSDVPRLKEKHETEGYRDGVTKGKSDTVQTGFDEGYGLGAVLGLKIGKILGLLEGICGAVSVVSNTMAGEGLQDEKDRLRKLLVEGKSSLKTENVFAKEYWGEDGIWKFNVPGDTSEGTEVVFPDVAAAHPLVMKWEKIVEKEVQTWNIEMAIMESVYTEEAEAHASDDAGKGLIASSAVELGGQKQELSW